MESSRHRATPFACGPANVVAHGQNFHDHCADDVEEHESAAIDRECFDHRAGVLDGSLSSRGGHLLTVQIQHSSGPREWWLFSLRGLRAWNVEAYSRGGG